MPPADRPVTLLIFPHQLFADHPGLQLQPARVILVEDSLFFGDPRYPVAFHKQKLWLHRASMKKYQRLLENGGSEVVYFEYEKGQSTLERLFSGPLRGTSHLVVTTDVHDFALSSRLLRHCQSGSIDLEVLPSPMFLNDTATNAGYRSGKKRWFMADFYKFQRRRLDILMDGDKPAGGEWSYDDQNRKKVPKSMLGAIPEITFPTPDEIDLAAREFVLRNFPENPGTLDRLYYPSTHEESAAWLERFVKVRLELFGAYEDAIVDGQNWLWHGVLTPALNIGLLTPDQVVRAVLDYAAGQETPLNSTEGFIRQIIGWREFMRATYVDMGVRMRNSNHWGHTRRIPRCFYDGTTGILPVDDVISRINETGYCHHIERLMTLGGFMFLCEFDPEEIYRWFMEMFVDSYDWVMVPNVYGMSQHADGGGVATKPYFSGSSYIRKMSNYPAGEWTKIWDGLYWRWILKHADALGRNPRWAMMCATARKMTPEKKSAHVSAADAFLARLNQNRAPAVPPAPRG